MGCASGKPESHTKKPALKQQSSNTKPTNPNNSQENPQLRNQPKTLVQKQNPVLPSQANPNPHSVQTQPTKPTIEQPHNNLSGTKHQVQKTNQLPSSQVKRTQSEPIKQVKEEPALPIQTPTKEVHKSAQKMNTDLSAIPERTDEFESYKKPQVQNMTNLKVQEKIESVKNSARSGRDDLRISVPDMQEDCLVSKITKNNQSADKIQNQSSSNKMHVERSNQKVMEHQDIRTDEIKINIIDQHESRMNQSSKMSSARMSSARKDEFAVLNEEQFDLNCEFDPNTLVVDMNKVAW